MTFTDSDVSIPATRIPALNAESSTEPSIGTREARISVRTAGRKQSPPSNRRPVLPRACPKPIPIPSPRRLASRPLVSCHSHTNCGGATSSNAASWPPLRRRNTLESLTARELPESGGQRYPDQELMERGIRLSAGNWPTYSFHRTVPYGTQRRNGICSSKRGHR